MAEAHLLVLGRALQLLRLHLDQRLRHGVRLHLPVLGRLLDGAASIGLLDLH